MKNIINQFAICILVLSFVMPDVIFARADRTALFSKARMEYKRKFASNSVVKNNKSAVERNVKISTNKQNVTNNVVNVSNSKKEYKIPEEKIAKLNTLIKDVNIAKENVVTSCGGISSSLSKIKSLATTSAISSTVGTGLAAGAIATGIIRSERKEEIEQQKLLEEEKERRLEQERQKRLAEEERKKQEEERLKIDEENKREAERQIKEKEQEEKKKQIEQQKQAEEEKKKKIKSQTLLKSKVENMIAERVKQEKQEQDARNKKYANIVQDIESRERELENSGVLTKKQKEYIAKLKKELTEFKNKNYGWGTAFYSTEKENIIKNKTLDEKSILQKDEMLQILKETEKKELEDIRMFYSNEIGFSMYSPLLTPEKLGNVRTGFMAGATAVSAVSLGTSAVGTVNTEKLYDKMKSCNKALVSLKKANSILNMEIWDMEADLKANDIYDTASYLKVANDTIKISKNIVKNCITYDTKDIARVKNIMTGSSVISGIGTATALTGTITSGLANSGKFNSDKENKLDMTSNIMAGITTGTSLATTGLSATAAAKLGQKLMEQATTCEATLN